MSITDTATVDRTVVSPTLAADAAPGAPAAPLSKKKFGFAFWLAVSWLGFLVLCATSVNKLPIRKKDDTDYLLAAAMGDGSVHWARTFGRAHYLGVDNNGNDLLTYALNGARISLTVGVATIVLGVVGGGILGMLGGFFRGRLESVFTFLTNALLSIPPLLFLLLLVSVMAAQSGRVSLPRFIATLGALTVPTYYRLVRASTLQQATREYVLAARSLGAKRVRILVREILPNVIKPIMAQALIGVGAVIVVEGTLSYLGAGMGGDTISWGRMMQDASGLSKMQQSPHAMFVPAGFIFLTVLSLNFVGDKIRERLEVKQSNI